MSALSKLFVGLFCSLLLLCYSCSEKQQYASLDKEFIRKLKQESDSIELAVQMAQADSIRKAAILVQVDSSWVEIKELIPGIYLDIRYATSNNFIGKVVYTCAACYLRLEVAKALMQVQDSLSKMGYALKFFDCYRPSSAQYELWKAKPDPRYVHPPKLGSMHSRGNAVDLTIVTNSGQELDMGTEFDYFGKEAYWNYTKLSKEILANRNLLKRLMQDQGFETVQTEWWHFSYRKKMYPLSNMIWPCSEE